MTWNHRIVLERFEFAGVTEETFSMREVYYDEDGGISSWTADPIGAVGDTWIECADTLARMGCACSLPVVDVRSGKPVEMSLRDARHKTA